MVVNKVDQTMLCTHCCHGRRHDVPLFKRSGVRFTPETKAITDSGYQGIHTRHSNSQLPKKKSKQSPLTPEDKRHHRGLASQRALNENVMGVLKRFKIIADQYRHRRKRFGLRFNLIAGIYNYELSR